MQSLITTLGAFAASDLGPILPHEHIFVDLGPIEQAKYLAVEPGPVIDLMATDQIEGSSVQARWVKLSATDEGLTPGETKILRAATLHLPQ